MDMLIGRAWLSSMLDTGMWIFGIGFPVSGIGHGVNLTMGETLDLKNHLVTELRDKAMFLWDLVAWTKETHPTLTIIIHSITYKYSYGGKRHTPCLPHW